VSTSVLLPVYNGARTLSAAIDSVLSQTHAEFDLIVIDDASTDASADVIRAYAERDERVRPVYHDRNHGLAATLNEGLELSEASLIVRMDQDDESLPDRLATQTAFMDAHPNVTVSGSFVYHMGRTPTHDRLVQFPTDPLDVRTTLRRHNCLYHPAVIMRREQIVALGGYRADFKNAEDYDLWLRVAKRHDLANIPVPLLRYRFSVDGMTLGRKWEQLYYVYLAQVASTTDDLATAAYEADARLRATDRRDFFRHVTAGTLAELLQLGRLSDAFALSRRMSSEVGLPVSGAILARGLVRQLLVRG
jgi:glycosyltransferase involved in cell wall biosynthesis